MDQPGAPPDDAGASPNDAGAAAADDALAPPPDTASPHSEVERLVRNASPGRLLIRVLLALLALGALSAGAFVAREAWLTRRALLAPMAHVMGATARIGNAAGPPEERPEHDVVLRPFDIDVTEVTVGAYAVCVKQRRCKPPLRGDYCNWGREDRDDHPVNCVDHEQAAAYCDWAGKRLPTEAEWEYAARGGDHRRFPWGDARPTPARLNACGAECALYGAKRGVVWPAMYEFDDGFPLTAPVGSFPDGQSPFGLSDMAGNVREWTSSPYCPYPVEQCGNEDEFVIRGSDWSTHFEMNVEATTRDAAGRSEAMHQVGFRCAR